MDLFFILKKWWLFGLVDFFFKMFIHFEFFVGNFFLLKQASRETLLG